MRIITELSPLFLPSERSPCADGPGVCSALLRERPHELTRLSSRTLPSSLFFHRFYLFHCVFRLARIKRKRDRDRERMRRGKGEKEVRGTAGRASRSADRLVGGRQPAAKQKRSLPSVKDNRALPSSSPLKYLRCSSRMVVISVSFST